MKIPVKRFKSMKIALKELEPFIQDGQHLQTGPEFERFDRMRSREILGNWLLCVVINHSSGSERLLFTSDSRGGDGIIQDTQEGTTWDMEHVMVPASRDGSAQDAPALILQAITNKVNKGGAAYASGKTLVVFSNARGGEWFPARLTRALPDPVHFDGVWVVALQCVIDGEYVYGVTRLHTGTPVWRVRIAADFESWQVEQIQ
jgi:hypothetical protein